MKNNLCDKMKDTDIVCDCYRVTVGEVKEYLSNPENDNKPLGVKLKELKIAQACRFCMYEDEEKIDVHFSKLIKTKRTNQ